MREFTGTQVFWTGSFFSPTVRRKS